MERTMNLDRMVYHPLGRLDGFPLHLGKAARVGEIDIAVFRLQDDILYALANQTAHKKGGPLAEGLVSGHYVYCPLRDFKIDLRTGEVQSPDTGKVKTFPVKLEGGIVYVGVEEDERL